MSERSKKSAVVLMTQRADFVAITRQFVLLITEVTSKIIIIIFITIAF